MKVCFFVWLFVFSIAKADDQPVKIEKAWLQAVPQVASATAAYMTIRNVSPLHLTLVKGTSEIASMVEPMITTVQKHQGHETMGMSTVKGLDIPAGGIVELKPGGDHLMLMGLLKHPKEGDRVKLNLVFEPGNREVSLFVDVLKQEPQ
ncbi:MAG: copper chaperone PCu(A)C [Verrucomicrobia bacterium]|nr:copper chaperone PCu(A)C [Verrucomicrobiota bacterium]